MAVVKKGSMVGVVRKKKETIEPIGNNYELLNVEFKESEDEYCVIYAYKLKVKNHAGKAVKLIGKFIFKDSDGFEVQDDYAQGFTVGPFEEHIEIGKIEIFNKKAASRITDIDTKLEETY